MNIQVVIVPHENQRYPTVGDWVFNKDGDLVITVSNLGDWKKETCVAVHEIIEAVLCKDRGIKEEDVSAFDIAFENIPTNIGSEPGNQSNAPYHKEHMFSTSVEMQLAGQLNLDWNGYEETINDL